MATWTLALVVALGAAHIVARTQGRTGLAGVLKPLPIALLAAAMLRVGVTDTSYRNLVVAALLASMAGDVLLIFHGRFVAGLLCFFAAHLLYITAFAPAVRLDGSAWALLVPFLGFAALVVRYLWPHLGRYRAPVMGYVSVISAMGWLATLRALEGEVAPASAALALLGAYSFMASDTILAVDRFARPVRGRHVAVMGTYYAAQVLLALSAV